MTTWRTCRWQQLRELRELCESRGGRPGLSVLMSLTVSVDVKQHWTMLRHWSQFVPNMSTDIRGHEALPHHHHHSSSQSSGLCAQGGWWVGWVLLYVHRNRRLIRDGSPGRPPRLSKSSWALHRKVVGLGSYSLPHPPPPPPPHTHTPTPQPHHPTHVPNKPHGFSGRKAPWKKKKKTAAFIHSEHRFPAPGGKMS